MQSISSTLSCFTPNISTSSKPNQASFRIKKLDRSNFFITNNTQKSVSINQVTTNYKPNHKLSQIYQELIHRHKSTNNLLKQEEDLEQERQTEVKQLLNDSKEEKVHDRTPKNTVGQEAIKKYYRHLKIINKVTEQNRLYDVQDSIYTAMHQQSAVSKLFPCKVGVIKYEGYENTISLNNMKYGDSYINVLKEGVSKNNKVENFYMKDNRITPRMSVDLLKTIQKNARSIVLQKNRIGAIGIQHISDFLQQRDCKIEVLDIEDNLLSNNIIEQFCRLLHFNKTLQILNLSKNFITNSACTQIASMLSDNNNLKELYLHWNQITSNGAILIFQELRNNTCLKVLDLSCNSLGIGQISCASAFSEMVIQNVDLIHVDLSFNQFNYKDTVIIADGLLKNQTIYGFHFAGNKGYVDSKGFLVPIDTAEEDQSQSQLQNRIKGCTFIKQNRIRGYRDQILKDCCWICEGWNQQVLQWKIGQSGDFDQDPIFIHLSYNDFLPLYLGKPENGLENIRMLPPGKIFYFFTTGEEQCIAQDQKIMNHHLATINDVFIIDQFQDVELSELNYLDIKLNKQIVDSFYEPTIQVVPRTKDLVYIPPKKKKQKKKWSLPISLFKDWRKDDDDLLQKCFETDWNGSRIPRIIKNEEDLENTKQFIQSIYRQLKDCYKQYSSLSPVGEIWAIQSNTFLQLLQNVKLIEASNNPNSSNKTSVGISQNDDQETQSKLKQSRGSIKQQDLDLKFIGTISGTEKGNPRKPERGMIRFQFIELWVRVAEEKYLKTGTVNTMFEAIKCLWEDHLKAECLLYPTQSWRDQRYWNEECDYCYKNYKAIMEHIFSKYSIKKVKPGQKNFMSQQELIDLTAKAGLNQMESFGSTVPYLSFNKAMMTQIDELKSDRIFQMNFVEVFIDINEQVIQFLEAFARIAEEANLPPFKGAFDNDQEWTYGRIKDLPLHYKLESLILYCLDNVADQAFKLSYPKPTTSFFTPIVDSDEQ